eukprot:6179099-Pleurochrysis_carterae.AAC.1
MRARKQRSRLMPRAAAAGGARAWQPCSRPSPSAAPTRGRAASSEACAARTHQAQAARARDAPPRLARSSAAAAFPSWRSAPSSG